MQVFYAEKKHSVQDKTVFSGRSPFGFENTDAGKKMFFDDEWLIIHAEAEDNKLYRCTGVECYALQYIGEGSLIGLRVE
jgi:hypothetical protein